ncbi:RGG repeats nuclear RNA binding protein B [Bienertia sinuspersici]
MATMNPFDLLGDIDNDDPSQIESAAAAQLQKVAPKKTPTQPSQVQQQKAAKLPSKPLPPTQAVRETKNDTQRGGGRGGGRGEGRGGGGRGRGGYNRDYSSNENAFNNSVVPGSQGDEGEGRRDAERRPFGGPRGPYRGGRRGGFNNDEGRDGERSRRTYERRSGTGRGSEFKREGAGRGNWGAQSEEVAPGAEEAGEEKEKNLNAENPPAGEDAAAAADGDKEVQPDETEEKEPEDKEMTLEEYQKLLEEKRKALLALKTEERKVEVDKELKSMQQLSNKKDDESVFIKLGSDKDKRKEAIEKEKVKKSVSINEFLKPAEGERFGGRGRGRGRGSRGGFGGGGSRPYNAPAPAIADPGEFPTLGGK